MDGFDDLLAPSRSMLEENPFEDPFVKARSSSPDPWASFSNPTQLEPSSPPSSPPAPPLSPQTSGEQSTPDRPSFGSPKSPRAERFVVSPLEQPSSTPGRSYPNIALGGESPGWQAQSPWIKDAPVSTPKAGDGDQIEIATDTRNEEQDQPVSPQTASTPRQDTSIAPLFAITVDDPQKVGDPIRGFTMYTVHCRTTSPLYSKSNFSVLRRYSDFLWLYDTLSQNNPGVVVPPTPEKNVFGRFDDQFVQQRRLALEKCIQKIANHPVLCKDPDLKLFLESDTFSLDIKHRKAEIAHERGGLMATIGQTIVGPRFHETDEWFDRQKAYLESLESQLRGLVKSIEIVVKHRTDLATATAEFAQNVSDLSSSDIGKQLSQSLASLAEVERKAQELQTTQAQQDAITLMCIADEYARLVNSVKLAFQGRVRTYNAWQNADVNLRRVKLAHDSGGRTQGRQNLGQGFSQVAEAERRALETKHEYEQVTKLAKEEVARFEQERIEDFKNALQIFLDGMISRQKTLIATWEKYQQGLVNKSEPSDSPSQQPSSP